MRLTPLRSPPTRPRTVSVRVHHGKEREDQKRKRIASLCIHAWRGSTVSTKVDTYRQSQFTHRHRETVGVGRCGAAGPLAPWARGMPRAGWAGRPTPVLPCAQDSAHEQGAIEPPGVRALCLRSTASQAPERPAASGWAGPRSGVYGVSCSPTPPRPTISNPELLLPLLLPLQVQGCKPCKSHYVTQPAITSRARIASHSSSIRHTRLIASRRSGSRCHTGSNPASV